MKIKLLLATLVALGVTAINSQAQSTDIVFTASAGYTNGNLVGQKNWTFIHISFRVNSFHIIIHQRIFQSVYFGIA